MSLVGKSPLLTVVQAVLFHAAPAVSNIAPSDVISYSPCCGKL